MTIPEKHQTEEFWLRVLQMAKRLVEKQSFPRRRYDDDIDSLIEDVVQQAYTRILEKPEPAKPIENWPGFFNRFLYYVVLERRHAAFEAHEAGWEKTSSAILLDEDQAVAVETQVPDPRSSVDELLGSPESDPEWVPTEDPRFWRLVAEELPGVTDEKCGECFRKFTELVFREGLSRRKAWRQVQPSCHGDRWAAFNRWMNKLQVTLMKRWLSDYLSEGGA